MNNNGIRLHPFLARPAPLTAVAVVILLACLSQPGLALAANLLASPWRIEADRISHQENPRTVTAEGKVRVDRESNDGLPVVITADWIRYEADAGMLAASGNVDIVSGGEHLTAEAVQLDLDRMTGSIQKTTLFLPGSSLHFKGDVVEKTGELSYHLTDGWVTSCLPGANGETPAWSIKAADVDLTMEGYAILRHARFYVRSLPLLYTPYLILPAKTIRDTGLLFPELSRSKRDGTGIVAPYFINLSPSADITVTPGYLGERGPLTDVEWRYAASPESQGWFNVTYRNDSKIDTAGEDYLSDGWLRTRNDRYWLRGKADHAFTNGITARLDLDVVSDRDYLGEYRKGIIGYDQNNNQYAKTFHRDFQEESLPFRENTLQVGKGWDRRFAGAEMLAVRDVWEDPATAGEPQALPRLLFAGDTSADRFMSQILWKSEYVNYWRREGIGAHRLDLDPSLVTRLPLAQWLEGTATLGLRETMYQVEPYGVRAWEDDRWQERLLWTARTDLATSLGRRYEVDRFGMKGFHHLVRPVVSYIHVPSPHQDDLPDIDMVDRIEEENRVAYGFANFFSAGRSNGRGSRDFGYLKLMQSMNLKEFKGETPPGVGRRPFSDLHLDLSLYPTETMRTDYETTWSAHGDGVTSYDFGLSFSSIPGNSLRLDYRYKLNPDQQEPFFYQPADRESMHEVNLTAQAALTREISMRGDIAHSLTADDTVEASMRMLYQPGCWGVELLASATPEDNRLSVIFSLAGIGRMLNVGLFEF